MVIFIYSDNTETVIFHVTVAFKFFLLKSILVEMQCSLFINVQIILSYSFLGDCDVSKLLVFSQYFKTQI